MTIWDGITLSSTLKPESNELRQQLANSAHQGDWAKTLELLRENPHLVNVTRPGGKSLYTPLHQVAYNDAPDEIVRELLSFGAWRTSRTADGDRPVDIARKREHAHLVPLLEPVYLRQVELSELALIQEYFHAVIRGRARAMIEEHQLRLPELEPLLEMEKVKLWFAVPGMYGGFSYWLEDDGDHPRLVTESWSRIVGDSGQRHEITRLGIQLVEEGFV